MKGWFRLEIHIHLLPEEACTSPSNGCLQYKRKGKIATFPFSDMKSSYEIRLIKGPCDVGHFSNLACEHY